MARDPIRLPPINQSTVSSAEASAVSFTLAHYTMYGSSASSGQTSVNLGMDGGSLIAGEPTVPVLQAMSVGTVGVSWVSDNTPADGWVLTFQLRRSGDSSFSDVATFSFNTS